MRVSVLTIGLVLAVSCGSLGCKSAPKMSWWKTADKSAAASTAAVAGAPQLPSEIAKQAEALASADPVKITTPAVKAPAVKSAVAAATTAVAGGAAPAYTGTTTAPSSYPTTGAQSFVPPTTASAKTAPSTAVVGSMANSKALPYDPTNVPPAAASSVAATSAAIAAAPAQADRYGMAAQDRYANTYPTTTTPAYAPASYPTTKIASAPTTTPTTNYAANAAVPASVPFAANPGSASTGNRYATQATPVASPVSTTLPSNSPPVQPASAVASVQPYRPGGTTSYPGTSANYEVATRPGTTSTTPSSYPAQGGVQYR